MEPLALGGPHSVAAELQPELAPGAHPVTTPGSEMVTAGVLSGVCSISEDTTPPAPFADETELLFTPEPPQPLPQAALGTEPQPPDGTEPQPPDETEPQPPDETEPVAPPFPDAPKLLRFWPGNMETRLAEVIDTGTIRLKDIRKQSARTQSILVSLGFSKLPAPRTLGV